MPETSQLGAKQIMTVDQHRQQKRIFRSKFTVCKIRYKHSNATTKHIDCRAREITYLYKRKFYKLDSSFAFDENGDVIGPFQQSKRGNIDCAGCGLERPTKTLRK